MPINDKRKSKMQLITELVKIRQDLAELEESLSTERSSREALEIIKERYQDLTENTSDWIWEVDAGIRYTYTNLRAADLIGYSRDEILGKTPFDFMTPEEKVRHQPFREEMMARPIPFKGLETEHIHKNGSTCFLEVGAVPVYDRTGRFMGFRGIARDITSRKSMGEALRLSDERFRLVSQASNDAIYDWDIVAGKAWLSEAHHALFGFSASHADFEWWSSHIHPVDRPRVLAGMHTALEKGEDTWSDEYRFQCADGRYIDVLDRGRIIRDDKGSPIRLVGSMLDMTERKMAETALRESESNLHALIENSPIAIIVHAPDTSIIMSNTIARHLLGLTEDQITGRTAFNPYWKFLRPDGSSLPLDEYPVNRVILRNAPLRGKIYGIIRPDCSDVIWVLINAQPLWDQAGGLTRIIVSFMDITLFKKAQEELLQSEAKYRFLAEQMNDIVWTADLDLTITYISHSVEKTLGYTQEERMGHKAGEFMTSEFLANALDLLEEEISSDNQEGVNLNRSVSFEAAFYHKNGSIVWLETLAGALRDDLGQIIGIHGVCRNITDRKRADEALRKSEAKYRDLMERINDVVWTADIDLTITYFSPSIEKTLGYTNEELIGHNVQDVLTPESLAYVLEIHGKELARDCLEGVNPDRTVSYEMACKHKNGSIMLFENVVSAVRDDHGQITGIQGVSRDITERKQFESEREKLINELKEALAEIKTLSGLLPICSYCKKIRDDKGYWNQLESYISKHSEALFTHSICPDCLKKELAKLNE